MGAVREEDPVKELSLWKPFFRVWGCLEPDPPVGCSGGSMEPRSPPENCQKYQFAIGLSLLPITSHDPQEQDRKLAHFSLRNWPTT